MEQLAAAAAMTNRRAFALPEATLSGGGDDSGIGQYHQDDQKSCPSPHEGGSGRKILPPLQSQTMMLTVLGTGSSVQPTKDPVPRSQSRCHWQQDLAAALDDLGAPDPAVSIRLARAASFAVSSAATFGGGMPEAATEGDIRMMMMMTIGPAERAMRRFAAPSPPEVGVKFKAEFGRRNGPPRKHHSLMDLRHRSPTPTLWREAMKESMAARLVEHERQEERKSDHETGVGS